METPPPQKTLRTVPFALHATRGIIRDRKVRRVTIFVLLTLAILMVIAGSTCLRETLNPHEHGAFWFAIYWLVCGWLTSTSVLLALFDLLMVRAEARAAGRVLRERVSPEFELPTDRNP
ncbi:MAG: hypothetical protein ABI946_12440 [Chthoniobacterales bacterium]